ncbi:MAG: hypothetical protein GEU97_22810 [Actinophytocola sp.]|nr:hypothetical protein [Actinophytocola sp.]
MAAVVVVAAVADMAAVAVDTARGLGSGLGMGRSSYGGIVAATQGENNSDIRTQAAFKRHTVTHFWALITRSFALHYWLS